MAIRIKRERDSYRFRSSRPLKRAEVKYYVNLRRVVKKLEQWTKELILPIIEREQRVVTDSAEPELVAAMAELNRRIALLELGERGVEMVAPALYDNDQFNRKEFIRGLKKVIGVDVSTLLSDDIPVQKSISASIVENTKLIKSIPEQYLERLANNLKEITARGDDYRSYRKDLLTVGAENIQELAGSTLKRARFIARDQMSKFNNSLNRIRQENLGITRYRWRTAGDSRVSEDHAANNRKVFEWANPPPTGHPGERPNCRCTAEPYLEDIWASLNRQTPI